MTKKNLLVALVLLGITFLFYSDSYAKEINIFITAYTLEECHANKGITASGKKVKVGMVAVSPDLMKKGLKFGEKIEIENLGTFVVADRTSKRLKNTIDIFMNSSKSARKFGKRKYILYLD